MFGQLKELFTHKKVNLSMVLSSIDADMKKIRSYCEQEGKISWTSREYQEAIHAVLLDKALSPGSVVEVGCYKGGLSAQLAYFCKLLNKKFTFIDVNQNYLDSTENLLKDLGLDKNTKGFLGSFSDYMSNHGVEKPISLAVIDGDHDYDATKTDIHALLSSPPQWAIFHDYSLRSFNTNENVQKAIEEPLAGCQKTKIGTQFNGVGHPTKDNPYKDGHYWEVPGSEGIKVKIDDKK